MAESTQAGTMPPGRVVHGDLVNIEVYGIYKAITELFGDKGWDVVYRSGEIVFDELKKQYNWTETEPLPLMKRVTQWMVDVGYAKELIVSQPSPGRLVYEMDQAVISPGVRKLRAENENSILAHWSSALLIAALKSIGIKAEMEDTKPEVLGPGRSREYWRLQPADR